VFDRIPGLTVVFADGGCGVFPPLMWREDAKARSLKEEMPWVTNRPSEYLARNVRFIARRDDFPTDPARLKKVLSLVRAEKSLLYGSNYPMWDMVERSQPASFAEEVLPASFFAQNAMETYPRLGSGVAV